MVVRKNYYASCLQTSSEGIPLFLLFRPQSINNAYIYFVVRIEYGLRSYYAGLNS